MSRIGHFVGTLAWMTAAAAAAAAAVGDSRLAGSVAGGACMMGADIAAMLWLLERALVARPRGQAQALGLAALFMLKLLVLFIASYYVLAVTGASALGFVTGVMIALAAVSWSSVRYRPR